MTCYVRNITFISEPATASGRAPREDDGRFGAMPVANAPVARRQPSTPGRATGGARIARGLTRRTALAVSPPLPHSPEGSTMTTRTPYALIALALAYGHIRSVARGDVVPAVAFGAGALAVTNRARITRRGSNR